METILLKIFATALALSQVTATPDAVKTQFDRVRDQDQVAQLLRTGCTHMRKAFDIEDINLEELIATALDDPQAVADENKAFHGINFADLQTAYRQFCKNENVAVSAVDLGDVIDFYNKATAELPDHTKLKGLKLPGASVVLDRKGERLAEVFEENQRRVWVPLADIPEHVQKAFLAAEDKRFYQHKGIDERGLIRAFIGNLASSGRPQGGSTITQQIVKNLLVGEDLTYERKIREMIVASRVEQALTKAEILELYLNSVYLGRGSWGIEMAARSYFGKPAKELTLEEGALLAGLTKGPNYFSPDRHPGRAQERLAYVLSRLQEDGVLAAEPPGRGLPPLPALVAYERPRRDIGFHFVDQVAREAKSIAGIDAITANSYTMRSTISTQLQRAVEGALQEGLSRYERSAGRVQFHGAEANLSQVIQRMEADKRPADKRPAWQRAVATARLPLYDVHWTPAIVLEKPTGKKGEAWRVGLADGRILPLAVDNATAQRKLTLYDVVLTRVTDGSGKTAARADLRVRPVVQGAVVVLENKTGRILAMTGGFSYPLSQLNRATQAVRQPGSAIKPLSYLAALGKGLQPNTLISDDPITLPPIGGGRRRERDYWTPKNYDGGSRGILTLRRALENSRNLATVHLLEGGIESSPEASLDRLCRLAIEAQIYHECMRYYPFVLGAQPVRPIDLAAFYASIANEGLRPAPHVVESIEHNGSIVYRHDPKSLAIIASVDRPAFYQLKTMLQGVLARGTARAIAGLSPYVAGKTGTSDEENDAWFVGFTNDVTVAVWIGYDNADGKRRTLGGGSTGGHVAVPIFEPVIEAVWAHAAPKAALAPPSPEAKRQLACQSIDLESGEAQSRRGKAFSECFRVDRKGKIIDTEYRLMSQDEATHAKRDREDD
jgi:penicillin-binding protein 1A